MPTDPLTPAAVVEVMRQLVRIPSVNPSLAPEEGQGEGEIADFARGWLEARGVRAWLEEAAPGRSNVVGEVGIGTGPTLVLCAHLDTVATTGMSIPPFEPRVEGGRLYGRGSYDMKGGAGAIMAAAVALASENRLRGSVLLALVADEEYASLGAADFIRRHIADACILTEPSEGRLILAHKGFVWAEVVTTGVAAHGSRWDLGASAIGKMGRIIAALEEFDRSELRRRVHPMVGPASLHCSLISGGIGISTYAAECRLQVERRTVPGETAEQVAHELNAVVVSAGEEAQVRCFFDRPPLEVEPQSAIARTVREAARVVTGSVPEDAGVAYWMDAALFAEAGIPSVNYGPAGDGAHGAVEWVDIDSVVSCARVLVEAARRFCSEAK